MSGSHQGDGSSSANQRPHSDVEAHADVLSLSLRHRGQSGSDRPSVSESGSVALLSVQHASGAKGRHKHIGRGSEGERREDRERNKRYERGGMTKGLSEKERNE